MTQLKPTGRAIGAPWGGAEKKDPDAGTRGERTALVGQVEASDPLRYRCAEEPRDPNDRHAVGDREVRGIQQFAVVLVGSSDPDEVCVYRDDLVLTPIA